jgi:hypothetical protein
VPTGPGVHDKGGEMFCPFWVYISGSTPPFLKALDVTVSAAPPLAGASVLAITGVVDASCANTAPADKVAATDIATKYVLLMILFSLGQTDICTTMMKLLHSRRPNQMER